MAWACSYARGNQTDRNSDGFLKAVNALADRMKKITAEIRQTRRELEIAEKRCEN